MPISIVINTYNAQAHLAEVLDSVKDFDEIVICDMESTDSTLDIARKYNCHIVTFEKKNYNFVEPAREFAIHSASNEWVLLIDADELVIPGLKEYLEARIKEPDCPDAFYISRRNKFLGKYCIGWSNDYQLRFFRHKRVTWPPRIHARPIIDGVIKNLPHKYYLQHLADESVKQRIAKMNEYTDNEIQKKATRNYGIFALFWRPMWAFFRAYILRGGFLIGKRGLVEAKLAAIYQTVAISKMLEIKFREQDK